MKKVIAVILTVLAVIGVISGCKKNNTTPGTKEISLEANATTGYEWSYALSEDGIVTVKDEYVEYEHEEGMTGVGGNEVYTLTAVKAGEVDLTCTYRRPWDVDVTSVAVFHLKVDENLKITEVSHDGTYFND